MVLGRDRVGTEIERILEALRQGHTASLECQLVDLKEEAGRRGRDGSVLPGTGRNEAAAERLAAEAACMANSDHGGALIVGVSDDNTPIGTSLETEWLRARIYELSDRRLTVDICEEEIAGKRVLVIRSPQAIEPIRVRGRCTWRVGDRCVDIDASTWHQRRLTRDRYDWSDLPSDLDPADARARALEIARGHLMSSHDPSASDLARSRDPELLRRLNVVASDGSLTNAGALAFIGRDVPALDYIRRSVPAGDSRRRVREGGLSLLEEIEDVESVIDAFNEELHLRSGLVIGRLRELPPSVVREALVNGVVHRDWTSTAPTVVEHVGRTLVVSSPGGFIGGVTPQNIITHPSQARNRALAELFAALRVAEREGIGVDRMVRDMIALGYPPPAIEETDGPYVRTALLGVRLDVAWIRFQNRLHPEHTRSNLQTLILLRRLVEDHWFDPDIAAPLLQLSAAETEAAIQAFLEVQVDGMPLAEPLAGLPPQAAPAWRLTEAAVSTLTAEDTASGRDRTRASREAVALHWARHRGRVSTTELGNVLNVSPTVLNRMLQRLEQQGHLVPSRATRTGRGFFYLPAPAPPLHPTP